MKNSVILYFFVLLGIVGVIGSKYAEMQAEAENKCMDNFHLNRTEIAEIMDLPIIPEDNDDLNNYLNCVWNETGLKNADGSINFENIKSAELEKFNDQTYFLKMAISMYLQSLTQLCENKIVDSKTNVAKTVNCIKKYNQEMQALMNTN